MEEGKSGQQDELGKIREVNQRLFKINKEKAVRQQEKLQKHQKHMEAIMSEISESRKKYLEEQSRVEKERKLQLQENISKI